VQQARPRDPLVLAVALGFAFGFGLTMLPLVRSGIPFRQALRLAVAADLFSITVMEIVDNAVMLTVPGAMAAGLASGVFWAALAAALVTAGIVAFPVNRWLIARGRDHAVVHAHH